MIFFFKTDPYPGELESRYVWWHARYKQMGGAVLHGSYGCWVLRVVQPACGNSGRGIHEFRGEYVQCINVINEVIANNE